MTPSAERSSDRAGDWVGPRTAVRGPQRCAVHRGPPFKQTIGIGLEKGDLLWTTDSESPHPFFINDALYVMPRVAQPAAACRKLDPLTGKVLGEFGLGVIGSCTRLTVTPNQFFYRPGGGEGRTVYFDFAAQKLADYEGVVRPGCFDGVVPANGRLYWMPLACDCWQVHGTFSMAPRAVPDAGTGSSTVRPGWGAPASSVAGGRRTTGRCSEPTVPGRRRCPYRFRAQVQQRWRQRLPALRLDCAHLCRRAACSWAERTAPYVPWPSTMVACCGRRRQMLRCSSRPHTGMAALCSVRATVRSIAWTRPMAGSWVASNWRLTDAICQHHEPLHVGVADRGRRDRE